MNISLRIVENFKKITPYRHENNKQKLSDMTNELFYIKNNCIVLKGIF